MNKKAADPTPRATPTVKTTKEVKADNFD